MKSNWLKLYSLESLQRCARCTFLPLCNSPYCTIHGLPQQKVLANKIQFNLAKKNTNHVIQQLALLSNCMFPSAIKAPFFRGNSILLHLSVFYLRSGRVRETHVFWFKKGAAVEVEKQDSFLEDPKAVPRLCFFTSAPTLTRAEKRAGLTVQKHSS